LAISSRQRIHAVFQRALDLQEFFQQTGDFGCHDLQVALDSNGGFISRFHILHDEKPFLGCKKDPRWVGDIRIKSASTTRRSLPKKITPLMQSESVQRFFVEDDTQRCNAHVFQVRRSSMENVAAVPFLFKKMVTDSGTKVVTDSDRKRAGERKMVKKRPELLEGTVPVGASLHVNGFVKHSGLTCGVVRPDCARECLEPEERKKFDILLAEQEVVGKKRTDNADFGPFVAMEDVDFVEPISDRCEFLRSTSTSWLIDGLYKKGEGDPMGSGPQLTLEQILRAQKCVLMLMKYSNVSSLSLRQSGKDG
jgi:hypothetical protein